MKKEFIKTPIQVSARHIHLTKSDFKKLFGKNQPTISKEMGSHHFAAQETVEIKNKNKSIKNVRLVAPFRDQTQVEISISDAVNLGIKPIIRISGSLKNTPAIEIKGPKGTLKLKEGTIVVQRHLHLNLREAAKFGFKQGDIVSVLVDGKRRVIFGNVVVRITPGVKMRVHLDTDEGNAAGISKKGTGYVMKFSP